ncbi:hypothetical protein NC652_024868 [Populus alba x Populus x berolinensis]|nr:hypothetical protein NC652_024868 [Populus alba x Populus x berolinensis]
MHSLIFSPSTPLTTLCCIFSLSL